MKDPFEYDVYFRKISLPESSLIVTAASGPAFISFAEQAEDDHEADKGIPADPSSQVSPAPVEVQVIVVAEVVPCT
jgi:hypothetical protein